MTYQKLHKTFSRRSKMAGQEALSMSTKNKTKIFVLAHKPISTHHRGSTYLSLAFPGGEKNCQSNHSGGWLCEAKKMSPRRRLFANLHFLIITAETCEAKNAEIAENCRQHFPFCVKRNARGCSEIGSEFRNVFRTKVWLNFDLCKNKSNKKLNRLMKRHSVSQLSNYFFKSQTWNCCTQ